MPKLDDPRGTMSTVQLMGWEDDQNAGGAFGHHCMVCGARFFTRLEISGKSNADGEWLEEAARLAEVFHVCA